MKWLWEMMREIEEISFNPNVLGEKRRDVVFIDRSPLTVKAFERKERNYDFAIHLMHEVKKVFLLSFFSKKNKKRLICDFFVLEKM